MQAKQSPQTTFKDWDILVVDDTEDSRMVLRFILEHHGAMVTEAVDGLSAFKQAIKLQPKLVITDLSMPTVDGWQFIDMLESDPRTSDIPVIACSAVAWWNQPELAERPHFRNYISKPIDPSTLVQQIMDMLAHAKAG